MIKTHLIEIFHLSCYQIGIEASLLMGIETKICKSVVWIYSHIDNKNTQRYFKINIKDLHQTQAIIF